MQHLNGGNASPYDIFTNATEEEFKELLENYLSENESQDGPDFSVQRFRNYVAKNGFYIHTMRDKVFRPISSK